MQPTRPRIVNSAAPEDMAIRRTIASAPCTVYGFPLATLAHSTAGYESAGAALRYTAAHWSVSYEIDGSTHGKRFAEHDEAAARVYFARLTDPAKVTAHRAAESARYTAAAAALAAAETAAAAYPVTAAKTYRSGWQWSADSFPGFSGFYGFAKTKTAAIADGRLAIVKAIRYAKTATN